MNSRETCLFPVFWFTLVSLLHTLQFFIRYGFLSQFPGYPPGCLPSSYPLFLAGCIDGAESFPRLSPFLDTHFSPHTSLTVSERQAWVRAAMAMPVVRWPMLILMLTSGPHLTHWPPPLDLTPPRTEPSVPCACVLCPLAVAPSQKV